MSIEYRLQEYDRNIREKKAAHDLAKEQAADAIERASVEFMRKKNEARDQVVAAAYELRMARQRKHQYLKAHNLYERRTTETSD